MLDMLPQLHCEITKSDCTKTRKMQGKALINKVINKVNKIAKELGLEMIEFEDDGYSYCADGCIAKNIGFARCDDNCNCHCHLK